ncbi:MAG TPA: biopolymer transporter ExbD [Verrucomicrobiae bacterium]|nr:biopolymer transporter ExbD [Verrucomicrobiae bacterium]
MTFTTYRKIARGRIDPAPMVDIMFLLLIFLVLSSPYVLVPGIGTVRLPTVNNPTTATFQGLVVTVSSDNLVFFNTERTTLDALPQLLRQSVRESRNPELIIQADRNVSYGTVMKIKSIAFEAGISAINEKTRSEVPTAVAPR